jgi:DNA-nicking Smr family endonuclease
MDEEPIRIPVTDIFDLHTVPAREVKPAVENYLEEAHRMGFHALRIIHGRGIGVQREVVRSILAKTPCQDRYMVYTLCRAHGKHFRMRIES